MEQEMMQMQQMPEQEVAEAGRGTDSVMAHMSLGELVIPRGFLDDPQVMQLMQQLFQQAGADINEFTVGHEANKINPETGYPEFFSFKKFFSVAAPIALSLLAPGIGTALGSTLSSAALSGIGGAVGGGLGGVVGGGGLKGALTGAALGGAGGYLSGGGLGNLAGSALPAGAQGPVQAGSGLLGKFSSATGLTSGDLPSFGSVLGGSGSGSGGGSSFLSKLGTANQLASLAGGFQKDDAIDDIKKQQLEASNRQLSNLESFDPSNITNDAGYQFNLAQGQKGLNSTLGAQGNLFSGRALQEAAQYNQNFANNALKDAYGRWQNKAGAQNNIYGVQGDINANNTLASSNNFNQTLSNAFGANVGDYKAGEEELLRRLYMRG
jgi:hypothetical protein